MTGKAVAERKRAETEAYHIFADVEVARAEVVFLGANAGPTAKLITPAFAEGTTVKSSSEQLHLVGASVVHFIEVSC
ncbi:hypothetical protein ACN38_g8520 [Penicillium nordicum]|uniref:Uncharacterized protein n=1 Tax=Penicillium nordicum TaxID=229535 RepID=A0A0M8P4P2_9EURO|nr:hypothetical protein ACN38_g8520 [Penicillium nordicum]